MPDSVAPRHSVHETPDLGRSYVEYVLERSAVLPGLRRSRSRSVYVLGLRR